MAVKETPSHYFSARPDTPSKRREIDLILPDLSASLLTDTGTFSPGHLDNGTRLLLLEAAHPPAGAVSVLDIGCGYGPVAVTLAHRCPDATIWAIDTNERARQLCADNAKRLGHTNITVAAPDEVPDTVRFDYIASNPPIRIGKPALHVLLTRWLGRLVPGGHADLVVQRHLGSDSLQRWLTNERGWPTERLVSRQGFRVLRVTVAASNKTGEN